MSEDGGQPKTRRRVTPGYCYDRVGHWNTKCLQAAARGDLDKAGEYKTKAYQWSARGQREEARRAGIKEWTDHE
ncbi:hypothetical protein ACTHPH_21880 [Paenibacillus pasadenensis]|uniref:hypothetical protein n=1 Tax=Paenibacillus pasadenensis TaxID=217090 RepID=UPI00048F27A9|nr:hypothetical protein [Paenibacillus pasadenensis]